MSTLPPRYLALGGIITILLLSCCATPTVEDLARARYRANHAGTASTSDLAIPAQITDADVINFTNVMITSVEKRGHIHGLTGYGVTSAQTTLGALAGAAQTIGWGAATASGLGMGATYVFGIGQIFDPKGHAIAYEQAYTALLAAKNNYYFRQLGGHFDANGVAVFKLSALTGVPSDQFLTPDGQTLNYRVEKIIKVLDDTLASKIPDLTDLKEANGEQPPDAPMVNQNSLPTLNGPHIPLPGEPTPPPAPSIAVLQGRGDIVTSLGDLPAAMRNAPNFYSDLMGTQLVNAKSTYPRTEKGFLSYINALTDVPTLTGIKKLLDAKAEAPTVTPTPAPKLPILQGPVTPTPGENPPPTPPSH